MSSLPPKMNGYVLCGALAVTAAASADLFLEVRALRSETSRMEEAFVAQISGLKQTVASRCLLERERMDVLLDQIAQARKQTAFWAARTKLEAQLRAEQMAERMETQQREQQFANDGELASARAVSVAANERIGEIGADLGKVRADAVAVRSELDSASDGVRRASSDLQNLDSLMARNTGQLAQLQARDERDYYAFSLNRSRGRQRVGDIDVQLKKADPRRNTYTVALISGARVIEQKDRNPNEPVQFYMPGAYQPYELVVNELGKDYVNGYLAAPKGRDGVDTSE